MFSRTSSSSFAVLAAAAAVLPSVVSAHGIVTHIDVNGQGFDGPLINSGSRDSPIWHVESNSPVTDSNDANLFCGIGATSGGQSPSIAAGSTVSFTWGPGYTAGGNWPHQVGPIIDYMGRCPDSGCASATSDNVQFFKVAQQGMRDDKTWVQKDLSQGQTVSFTIPADLAPGEYLIRHEVLSEQGNAEFYPSCSSWTITGGGGNSPSNLVKFPGAYSPSDAGISVSGSGIYNLKSAADYTFPGPAPISEGGNSGSSQQPQQEQQPAASSSSSSASPSASPAPATQPQVLPAVQDNSSSNSSSSSYAAASTLVAPSTPAAVATAAPSTSEATSSIDACNAKWTDCNAKWTGSGDYTCQTEFVQCLSNSGLTRRNAHRAARSHRRSVTF